MWPFALGLNVQGFPGRAFDRLGSFVPDILIHADILGFHEGYSAAYRSYYSFECVFG